MAKPELGAKRQCQACAAKFFDLNRDPIVCPKCGTVFQGATMRAERVTAKDEESEDEQVAAAGVEMVSLDEVEAAEEKAADPVVDDIDVEDDETGRRHLPRRGGGGRGRRQLADRRRNRAGRGALTNGSGKKYRRGPCRPGPEAAIGPARRQDFRPQPEDDGEKRGAIAQLGERFNGIEEVVGSIPSGSTNQFTFFADFSIPLKSVDITEACPSGGQIFAHGDGPGETSARDCGLGLREENSFSVECCVGPGGDRFAWTRRPVRNSATSRFSKALGQDPAPCE